MDFLSSRQHHMLPDVPFEFTPLLSDTNRDLFPAVESIPKPFYTFDPTGSKSERWHDGGLSLHGPYTANTFTPNRPRVCVVCQRAHKGDVEKFLRKFISGVQDEVDSVKELMSELGDYEVEYAFLQISQNHPNLLFDRRQKGLRDFDTGRTKGIYAPPRSLALQLSNKGSLLCLTGASEVKRPDDGLPRPLFLSLHRDSSFMDMTYFTRQVFAFACHSWRTFLPASKPVTVQYSDLIANTLGHLAQGERWNPDVMLGRIGKSRWFL